MKSHKELENHLDRYSGLILYMREMDELAYGKLCAVSASLALFLASVDNSSIVGSQAYFSSTSQLHNTQMTALLSHLNGSIKRTPEDEPDNNSP
jgi:hypothetical protein